MMLVRHPVLCNYYLTYRCNATCSFCDIWERPSPYVTLEEAEKNFADLKKLGVKVIDFTGGEPLLHRSLPQLLERAQAYGFITTVTTNGLLYPKQAQSLAGKVDMLHFSLDSVDEVKHNQSRGVDCYRFVMQSLDIAAELGERPDILFTVFEDNLEEIPQVLERITRPRNLVLILNPVFEYNQVDNKGGLSAQALRQLEYWGRQPGVYLNSGFVRLRQAGGNQISQPICKAGSTTVVISPDNKLVLPCYHLGLEEIPIEGKLYERWHSPEVQALIAQEGRLPGCQGCAINCYMQPSFAVNVNRYWFAALPSTLKYNRMKGTWKALFRPAL